MVPQAVQRLFATASAFAALLEDGSVLTWGDPETGGDSSSVQEKLKEVGKCEGKNRERDIRKSGVWLLWLLWLWLLLLLLFPGTLC